MGHGDFIAHVADYGLDWAEVHFLTLRHLAQIGEGDVLFVLKVLEPESPRLLAGDERLEKRGTQVPADFLEGGPLGGVCGPAAGHQSADRRGHAVAGLNHRAHAGGDVFGQVFVLNVIRESELACHELVEDDAKGVDVDGLVERLAEHDRWGHVDWTAFVVPFVVFDSLSFTQKNVRKPKVGNLGSSVTVEKNVCWLR